MPAKKPAPKPKQRKSKKTPRAKRSSKPVALLPSVAASLRQPATPKTLNAKRNRWLRNIVIGAYILFASLFAIGLTIDTSALIGFSRPLSESPIKQSHTYERFRQLSHAVTEFEHHQTAAQAQIIPNDNLEQALSAIQVDIQVGRNRQARTEMDALQRQLDDANNRLAELGQPINPAANISLTIPILMYHDTPADFDAQLSTIQNRGYTTIKPSQLAAALEGRGTLPSKPVLITFDDGFSNQVSAFESLRRRNMLATYYIITSGERSRWCVGASRRYQDPLQPPGGCGDSYMNWNEIKRLDASGIITIGAHTVDHANLASLSPADQEYEIVRSKTEIESRLGHPIRDFAYPYGAFTSATVEMVRRAGFETAVTTIPGVIQTSDTRYTLRRIRDTSQLP